MNISRRDFLFCLSTALAGVSFTDSLWANTATKVSTPDKKIWVGSEVLRDISFAPLKGKRVGLITHPAAISNAGESTINILRKTSSCKLTTLFGAEHGLHGDAKAGIEVKDSVDKTTGLPIYSLYGPGPTRQPTQKMLKNVDILVYDIQDTGCRSYTFISTLGLAMESAANYGKQFIVLDRPNPLSGLRVEGNLLDPKYKSFVSQWNIPYVYGMTAGELAKMINGCGWISKKADLKVVKMRNWQRSFSWASLGRKWKATSPNIPYGTSPLFYVATGILGEVSGLNIGIGTNHPFETVGSSWITDTQAAQFTKQMNSYKLNGVKFEKFSYKIEKRTYRGFRIHFTDPTNAPLLPINFYTLDAFKKVFKRDLYKESNQKKKDWTMLDKLCGGLLVRNKLKSGGSASDLVKAWKSDESKFLSARKKYLLY